ncbi:MAG: DUF4168 domain-containing protein [Desulfonatronovibrionaceae bacterium]
MDKQGKTLAVNLKLVLAFSLLMVLCAAGMAQAQDDAEGMEGQEAPAEVSDSEANDFAEAFNAIRQIQEEFTQEAQGIEDDSEIRELQQTYEDKMIKEVENKGLTVQRYNEIAQAMQQDEDLRQKIEGKMSEMGE